MAVGDVLAEVETDKAVMELVARAGGTLLRQMVPAGATVPVSEIVALIGEPGEAVDNGKPAVPPEVQDRPIAAPAAPTAKAASGRRRSHDLRTPSRAVDGAGTGAGRTDQGVSPGAPDSG